MSCGGRPCRPQALGVRKRRELVMALVLTQGAGKKVHSLQLRGLGGQNPAKAFVLGELLSTCGGRGEKGPGLGNTRGHVHRTRAKQRLPEQASLWHCPALQSLTEKVVWSLLLGAASQMHRLCSWCGCLLLLHGCCSWEEEGTGFRRGCPALMLVLVL